MMRKIFGTLIGIVFAIIVVDTGWSAATNWFPPAMPNDASDATVLARFVMAMPRAGQGIVALGWFVAGFVGAYAGLRVAQWRPAGWIAAVAVLAAALWDLTQLAQPVWLQVASLALPVAGAWLAERHFHRARRGDPLLN